MREEKNMSTKRIALLLISITIMLVVGCESSTSLDRIMELEKRIDSHLEMFKMVDAELRSMDSRIVSSRNKQLRIVSLLAKRNIEKMKTELTSTP